MKLALIPKLTTFIAQLLLPVLGDFFRNRRSFLIVYRLLVIWMNKQKKLVEFSEKERQERALGMASS